MNAEPSPPPLAALVEFVRSQQSSCADCAPGQQHAVDFVFAYQPIVDVGDGTVFAHEALVRGRDGAGAATVLAQVSAGNRFQFDQACRVEAIRQASALGIAQRLSINFLANAVREAGQCIRATLVAANMHGLAPERIMFEVQDRGDQAARVHAGAILQRYRELGFLTALDRYHSASPADALALYAPDIVKLDIALVRGIEHDPARRRTVAAIMARCDAAHAQVIAVGVESVRERDALRALGIDLMQGNLFCPPALRALGKVPVW